MCPFRYTTYSQKWQLTERWLHACSTFTRTVRISTVYSLYRWKRLVEKTKKISTTILKSKLPRFTDQHQKTPPRMEKEKSNLSPKDMAEAHKSMDIAKECGIDLRQILTFNLVSASPLFDGDTPLSHQSVITSCAD